MKHEELKKREVKREVKQYEVKMTCKQCGNGEMIFTGERYLTSPPYNVHKCSNCECKEEFLGVEYPKYEFLPVENELKTFADKIRSMTDEELADWIVNHDEKTKKNGYWTREQILNYLKVELDIDDRF